MTAFSGGGLVMQPALPLVIEAAPLAPLVPIKRYVWGPAGSGMAFELVCGHWEKRGKRRRVLHQKRCRCHRCSGRREERAE